MSDQDNTSVSVGRGTLTETDLRHHSQELGMIGKIFGSKEHAPINIAGTLLVMCVGGAVLTPLIPVNASVPAADILKLLGSIALAALTFLGGYLGGKAAS